jgi:hypothetical protein
MNSIMTGIGAVFRTPFAIIGFVLATMYGIVYAAFWLLLGLAWLVTGLPLSFVGAAMGGSSQGKPTAQRFKEACSRDVRNWKENVSGAFGLHADLLRWWVTGSADKPHRPAGSQ